MKNRNLWILVGVVIIVAVIIAGVIRSKNPETQNGQSIEVGVLLSQTGTVGEYGQRSLKGLQIAVDEINGSKALEGQKLEPLVEDAKSEPKDAVSAYQKLVNTDGVKMIIGDVYSSTTLAIAPLAEKDHVLLLAPGASNPKMRDMGEFIFRNWTSDEFDGRALAEYARNKMGLSRVAIIYQQVDYTVGLAQAFKDRMSSLGGTVADMETVSNGAPEARQVVAKIAATNPPAIYVCAASKESGVVVKYLRQAQYKGQIFANLTVESPEFLKLAGSYADGIIFSTPAFDPDDPTPRVRQFVQAYKTRYGVEPDVAAGHAYDSVYLLVEAIRRAHSSDPAKVKDAMYGIKEYSGVTGSTTFDKYGDVVKDILIKRMMGGKGKKLERFKVVGS